MEHERKISATRHHDRNGGKYALPIAAVLAVILIANIVVVAGANSKIGGKIKAAEELAKPPSLNVTIINVSCIGCFDVSAITAALKQFGATVTESKLESGSPEAKSLIKKYNITRLPAVIVKGDTVKSGLDRVWSSVGTIESDGALVMRNVAPFVDTLSGDVLGKASVTFLNNSGCTGCYDVTVHRNILKKFGVAISDEKTLDAGSEDGKALLSKYNITKVPTVLISPDAKYYSSMNSIWAQVGTIEPDGWYVFRSMDAMQGTTYYDLALNREVNQTK